MGILDSLGIKSLVAGTLGAHVGPLTITRMTAGTPTPGSLINGTNPTLATHTAKGYIADYTVRQIDGTFVRAGDRVAVVYTSTITPATAPQPGDRITVDGLVYDVVRVEASATQAAYHLQVRRP